MVIDLFHVIKMRMKPSLSQESSKEDTWMRQVHNTQGFVGHSFFFTVPDMSIRSLKQEIKYFNNDTHKVPETVLCQSTDYCPIPSTHSFREREDVGTVLLWFVFIITQMIGPMLERMHSISQFLKEWKLKCGKTRIDRDYCGAP